MSINDKLPGLNWRVPANTDNLEFREGVVDTEILESRRMAIAADLSIASPGIISAIDPSGLDGTDTTEPLMVQIDPDNPAQVLIYPGAAVTLSGHRIVVKSVLTAAILSSNVVGAQTVIYLYYQNEEIIPLPVRNRMGDIASRRDVVSEEDMVKSLLLADYAALDTITKTRTISLALTTVQETSAGVTESIVDLSTTVISYNRPWFSMVDAAHRGMKGNGTSTSSNPHGLDLNELSVAGNLPFYQGMIGRGIIIAPDESLPYVPGTACTETIPGTRWIVDTTGFVTGIVNAKYVTLIGYPVALGSCVEIDGNEDTDSAKLLAARQVLNRGAIDSSTPRRTNILYVDPNEPIDAGATYELRYTSVSSLEPPSDFNSDPELVFGVPQAREAIIADGLAFNSVPNPILSTELLGAIPRRIWVLFDDEHGLIHIPQVVVPFSRLSDAVSDKFEVSTVLYGPGRVRVWMTGAIPSASLSVPLTISGKDKDGVSLSSTITFDSTWVDNPAPSSTEQVSQMILVDGVYAEITDITVGTRVADGPSTAIVVEFVPEPVYESTDIDHALPTASIFWDGYRAERLTDEREITINLNKIGPSRAEIIGESVLTHHSIWPALGAYLVMVSAEDADQMVNSDQRLTRRWSPRGYKGNEDLALSSSFLAGRDSFYYSKAFRGIENCKWLMVTLLGNPAHAAGEGSAQFRFTVDGDEGTWSSWIDFEQSDVTRNQVVPAIDLRPLSFIKYLPGVGAFTESNAIFKFQVRFSGDWESMVVFASDEDLRTQTFDFLVSALSDAFKIEHWEPGTPDAGAHKSITVVPVNAAAAESTPRFDINLHAGDTLSDTVLQAVIQTLRGNFSVSSDGSVVVPHDIGVAGDGYITGNANIGGAASVTGDVTSLATVFGEFLKFNATQKVADTIPNALFKHAIDTADGDVVSNWTWQPMDATFVGAAPPLYAPLVVASGAYICIPVDAYVRQKCVVDSIVLYIQRISSGGAATLTVLLQEAGVLGSGATWTTVASDSVLTAEAAGRQGLEFNMGDAAIRTDVNMYRLRIVCDVSIDLQIARAMIQQKSASVDELLNQYP